MIGMSHIEKACLRHGGVLRTVEMRRILPRPAIATRWQHARQVQPRANRHLITWPSTHTQ